MPTFNLGGQDFTFPEGSTLTDVRKIVRKQDPVLYRKVFLGQTPNMAEQARNRGAQQMAQQTGPLGAFGHSAVDTGVGLATGARRLFNRLTGDQEEADQLKRGRAQDKEVMGALAKEHPIASFLGSAAPYAAVPVGPAAGIAGKGVTALGSRLGIKGAEGVGKTIAGSTLADAALIGAGTGALENPDDPLAGAIKGAAFGGVGSAVGNRLFAGKATPTRNPAVEKARAAGIAVSPAERYSLSPSVARFENALETYPYIRSTAGKKLREKNQQTMNSHLREALTLPSNAKLTGQSMEAVKEAAETAIAAPMRVSRDLRKTLHQIAERQTDITARVQPQASRVRALLKMINDKGGTDLGPESVRRVMVDLTEAANKAENRAVRKAYLDAREEFVKEFGKQNGPAAENLIRSSIERLGLADAVQKSIRKSPAGEEIVDYEKILTSFYRNKQASGPIGSPTGFKGILEAAEPFPAHGFGVRGADITAPSNMERFLSQGAVSGPLLTGAATGFNPAAMAAAGITPPILGVGHFSGAIPRVLDRGILGALVPGNLGTTPGQIAAAAGRGGSLGLLEEE